MWADTKAKLIRKKIPPGKRLVVISDIHGNLPYLQGLLQKVRFDRDDILVLLGDMVEKGRESLKTLHYIMDLEKHYTVWPVCGNCDSLWHFFLREENLDRLKSYLQFRTHSLMNEMLAQVGISRVTDQTDMKAAVCLVKERFAAELQWLENLPNLLQAGPYVFAHAGIRPDRPLMEQKRKDVLEMKAFYEQPVSFHDYWCIVGHWPVVLYHSHLQDANPIIDRERQIISIDGGNVLKRDGQLNALLIQSDEKETFSWEAYDDYPQDVALDEQEASQVSWNIPWLENEVRILRKEDDFVLCEQVSSGYQMWVIWEYLYEDKRTGNWTIRCEDSTDYCLEIHPGDVLSVINRTSRGFLVKKNGISGWYYGRLAKTERQTAVQGDRVRRGRVI